MISTDPIRRETFLDSSTQFNSKIDYPQIPPKKWGKEELQELNDNFELYSKPGGIKQLAKELNGTDTSCQHQIHKARLKKNVEKYFITHAATSSLQFREISTWSGSSIQAAQKIIQTHRMNPAIEVLSLIAETLPITLMENEKRVKKLWTEAEREVLEECITTSASRQDACRKAALQLNRTEQACRAELENLKIRKVVLQFFKKHMHLTEKTSDILGSPFLLNGHTFFPIGKWEKNQFFLIKKIIVESSTQPFDIIVQQMIKAVPKILLNNSHKKNNCFQIEERDEILIGLLNDKNVVHPYQKAAERIGTTVEKCRNRAALLKRKLGKQVVPDLTHRAKCPEKQWTLKEKEILKKLLEKYPSAIAYEKASVEIGRSKNACQQKALYLKKVEKNIPLPAKRKRKGSSSLNSSRQASIKKNKKNFSTLYSSPIFKDFSSKLPPLFPSLEEPVTPQTPSLWSFVIQPQDVDLQEDDSSKIERNEIG